MRKQKEEKKKQEETVDMISFLTTDFEGEKKMKTQKSAKRYFFINPSRLTYRKILAMRPLNRGTEGGGGDTHMSLLFGRLATRSACRPMN